MTHEVYLGLVYAFQGTRTLQPEKQRLVSRAEFKYWWSCQQQWSRHLGPHQDQYPQILEGLRHANCPYHISMVQTQLLLRFIFPALFFFDEGIGKLELYRTHLT